MKPEINAISIISQNDAMNMTAILDTFSRADRSRFINAREAKNPFGTSIGRDCLGTSFAFLQKVASNPMDIEAARGLYYWTNACLFLAGNDVEMPAHEVFFRALAYGVVSQIGKGQVKTIGISAWKKMLMSRLGGLEYVAPKKEYRCLTFEELKYEAREVKAKVISEKVRSMTPAEIIEAVEKMRVNFEARVASMLEYAQSQQAIEAAQNSEAAQK